MKPEVYRPHITLARNLPRRNSTMEGAIEEAGIESVEWQVNELVLMDSTATRSGSDYRVLARWPLA